MVNGVKKPRYCRGFFVIIEGDGWLVRARIVKYYIKNDECKEFVVSVNL